MRAALIIISSLTLGIGIWAGCGNFVIQIAYIKGRNASRIMPSTGTGRGELNALQAGETLPLAPRSRTPLEQQPQQANCRNYRHHDDAPPLC